MFAWIWATMQQNTKIPFFLDPQRAGSPPLLIDIDIPENDLGASNLSNSNPSLNSASRPSSMNLSMQTKEELINLVQDLQSELTSLVSKSVNVSYDKF